MLSLFKTKITVQNKIFKTQNNFSSISNQHIFQFHFNIQFQYKINIQNYISKFFSIPYKNQIKMSETIELSYVWDHTIKKILNYDLQSKMGNLIKEWVVFNKLEDFNSLLKYTDDDFTSHQLEIYVISMKIVKCYQLQFYNLRWYIQHLIDENEYQYDDDEWTNPLSESTWIYETNKHFMKYVNFTYRKWLLNN